MNANETVTLGMGCFWGPEALFGQYSGVVRTRVGYAGGTADSPTYREMEDHSETLEIDFDNRMISLDEILEVFWDRHDPDNINEYKGRQYRSLLFYRDGDQETAIRNVYRKRQQQGKGEPATDIVPFAGFHLAEERHQKYYLKRYPDAVRKLNRIYPTPEQWLDSTLTARLNGLAKGYVNMEQIKSEINRWPIDTSVREEFVRLIAQIRW